MWRPAEGKKDTAKIFTIAFIIVGIGILGVLVTDQPPTTTPRVICVAIIVGGAGG